jgi:hypothetical protein
LVAGCVGPLRPALLHELSEVRPEREPRDARLDSASATSGPEQHAALSPAAQKLETGVATVAALIALIFSHSSNVMLGIGGPIDENALFQGASEVSAP